MLEQEEQAVRILLEEFSLPDLDFINDYIDSLSNEYMVSRTNNLLTEVNDFFITIKLYSSVVDIDLEHLWRLKENPNIDALVYMGILQKEKAFMGLRLFFNNSAMKLISIIKNKG